MRTAAPTAGLRLRETLAALREEMARLASTRPDRAAIAAWIGHILKARSPAAALSAAIHAALLVLLVLAWPEPDLRPPELPQSVSVDILTGAQFDALRPKPAPEPAPAQPIPPPPPLVAAPAIAPPAPALPALSHARRILSSGALDRVARASLTSLQLDARFEQLCDVEAMEQIVHARRRFVPERIMAYATENTKVEADTLVAPGAAFLSHGRWYHLAYRCRATADGFKVLSFDFAIGPQFGAGDPILPTDSDD
jgi:hypothetical protein